MRYPKHEKVPYGLCGVCGHRGDDCLGMTREEIDRVLPRKLSHTPAYREIIMIEFYQERKTKDFLCVDTSTRAYYKRIGKRELEGRATCIAGLPASMATTGISLDYLKNRCKRVEKSRVPSEYYWRFGLLEGRATP